jgi:hypothetical protein
MRYIREIDYVAQSRARMADLMKGSQEDMNKNAFSDINEFERICIEKIDKIFDKLHIKALYDIDRNDNPFYKLPNFYSNGHDGRVSFGLNNPKGFIRVQVNGTEILNFDKRAIDKFYKFFEKALIDTRK